MRSQSIITLGKISDGLLENIKLLSNNDLNESISELDKILNFVDGKNKSIKNRQLYSTVEDDSIKRIRRILNPLQTEKDLRVSNIIFKWINSNPFVVGGVCYIILLSIFCLILLRFRPLWILKINNNLSKFSSEFPLPPLLDASSKVVSFSFRIIFGVGLLHYHPRVLDSWIAIRINTARKRFAEIETVSARSIHITTVPVLFDHQMIPEITSKILYPLFSQKQSRLLIYGEGGLGKTSLACQIAKWSMSENESERLSKNLMIPILLEQNLDLKVSDGKSLLLEQIRGQLQTLTEEIEPIPEELCNQLLRKKRILLIVDHFSEMSESTRKEIRPIHSNFSANALIVTSRIKEKLDEVPKNTINPLRIGLFRLEYA